MSLALLTPAEEALARSLFEQLFDELAAIGSDPDGGTTRLAWTAEAEQAARWFGATSARLGLETSVDRNGNRWAGAEGADAVVTGSHLDTVPHGGRFDGALGVVCGLIAVHLVNRRGPTKRPLSVVAFADEEGGRFDTPTFGSRLAVGELDAHAILERRDAAGVSLRTALRSARVDPERLGRDDAVLERIGAFVELHVEQGMHLWELGQPLGVATTIKPHGRWRIDLTGEANHGGTTAMGWRRDPMLALAELLTSARRAACVDGALVTVGKLEVWPNASNSVAGRVSAWLDVRSDDEAALDLVVADVIRRVRVVAGEHRVEVEAICESRVARVRFSERLRAGIVERLARFGLDVVPMDTGAGHDAGALAAERPTAMLFVRNRTGVSHSPAEAAEVEDCITGIGGLTAVLADLAGQAESQVARSAGRAGGADA
jgi:N-carbamoyl-L-amino-acid hydrolase